MKINALQTFQLLRFVTTLFIGILLAKIFGLPTTDIAIYEVLLFLGNFLSFFWISGGIKSLLSLYPKSEQSQTSILIHIALLLLFLGIIAGGGLYLFQDFIIHQFTQYEELKYVGLISLFIIFNAPASLTEYIYLVQKKEKKIIRYGLILFTTQLIAIIFPLVFNLSLKGIFQGLLLWSIFKFIWLLTLLKAVFLDHQKGKERIGKTKTNLELFNLNILKKIVWLLFPLSLHMLIGGGMEYIDGFIVTSHFADGGMFAIFRYGARELPLVTILTVALTATLIPLAVENQSLVLEKIKSEVVQLSKWLFPVTIVLMLISPYLFPIIYNKDFVESAHVFNIYLLIISSRLLLPQVIIMAQQHNFVLVWSAIIEILINLGLSLYLVRDYGLEGIAVATVIAYLVNKLILILYNHFKFGIPINAYLNIKSYLIYNSLLFFIFFLTKCSQ